ncbi:MAG: PilZ domain-containing protein [Deltaproteobacteria bacterium]|nr:PilZ domain-containing protein [Deltaproteobacteria bacterium]
MNPHALGTRKSGITQAHNDRRKQKRFLVQDGGIAFVTPSGPASPIVGHIIDVSMTGLSFRYISEEALSGHASEVTIALPENRCNLRRLPVETVSDFEIAKMPFGLMTPRRHGVKFGELTPDQRAHLQDFIARYGIST